MKTYHPANHWAAFRAGASTHVGRRCNWIRRNVRDDVTRAAIECWPARHKLTLTARNEIVHGLYNDRGFRKELGYGTIWLILLSALIQAILAALVDYWFETKETEGQVEL